MRIDKYLKVSRIIKRRTVSNNACDSEQIFANGRPVKASYNVKIGDVLEISFGSKKLKVKVLSLPEHEIKSEAASCYEVIE